LAFDVKVADVNTMKMKGKNKRFGRRVTKQPDWKKAIVTLQTGHSIELFEGI
ncbi:MAG: 50S ribosomal protein L23, partial [Dehalococcoidia bacterium]|nr:50S ribosomal protein L23 [Dehalococcoidia bacterium]